MVENLKEKEESEDLPLVLTVSLLEWFSDIAYFLTYKQFPKHLLSKQKRNLKLKATKYVIWSDTLYKCGIDGSFLKCVDKAQHEQLLNIFHNEVCGGHFSSTVTAFKIIRHGYC